MPQAWEQISGTPKYSLDKYWIRECDTKLNILIIIYIGNPLKIETLDLKVQYLFKKNICIAANKYPNRPEIR